MSTVRQHTRRTKSGGTTTVTQHSRRGGRTRRAKPKQRGLRARRAFRNIRKGWKAARRSRKGQAAVYLTLGFAELGGWLTLRGLAFSLTTVALLAGALAFAASRASGGTGGATRSSRTGTRRSTTSSGSARRPARSAQSTTGRSAGPSKARQAEIKRQVCAEFAGDRVRPDEVVLKPNGDIVVDRRATHSWAKPMVVGRWKS